MVTRKAIVASARSWLGTPYHHQASCKGVGCDCLGLIRGIWRELYGPEPEAMPPYTRDWGNATGSETLLQAACRHLAALADVSAAEPGDVFVFRMRDEGVAKHAGILTGPSRLVHAQEGLGVVEIELGLWWRRRAVAAFAFPEVADFTSPLRGRSARRAGRGVRNKLRGCCSPPSLSLPRKGGGESKWQDRAPPSGRWRDRRAERFRRMVPLASSLPAPACAKPKLHFGEGRLGEG